MRHLILALMLGLAGCAFAQKQLDYIELCNADPACLSDAKSKAALVGTVTSTVYPPLGGAAAGAALVLALWFGGRKKQKPPTA